MKTLGLVIIYYFKRLLDQNVALPETPRLVHSSNCFLLCHYWKYFVKYTNKYAKEFVEACQPGMRPERRHKRWKLITVEEMQAFIIILVNMALNAKNTNPSFWTTTKSQMLPWFSRMMPKKNFQAILKFFHMRVNTRNFPRPNHQGSPNPCNRFQPLVDHMSWMAKMYFTPGANLSVDESMVATKAHSQLLQYIPKKHHRWGVKLWFLCEAATHYCFSFAVCKGARGQDGDTRGLGFKVVTDFLRSSILYGKGYHVYIENFFTSIKLAKYLFRKGTFLTGTVRMDRKGIPQAMKPRFRVGETK